MAWENNSSGSKFAVFSSDSCQAITRGITTISGNSMTALCGNSPITYTTASCGSTSYSGNDILSLTNN